MTQSINMPSSYLKDIFREIKISLGRFLSILCIVAIGVAFFAGIKASAPDMKNSADMYFDTYNVQDIQIYSTLGLTKKDVKAIQKLKGVKSVQPNFSMDTLSQIDSTQMVIKVISYEIDQKMNKIRVVEGRMPERENECLIEASSATNKLYGTFHIGDTIKLQSGTDEALSNSLKNTKYKIVGTCYNPNYLSYEKGSSNIGSGTVNSFIYIQNSNVLKDYYTEVDVCVKGAKELDCYSDAYFDVVDPVLKRIKKIANKQIDVRIQSYQSELDGKKQEANDELNDAENKLNDAQDKIDSGLAEIQSNEIKLQNSKNQIDQWWNEYYANLQLLDNIPTLQNAIAQIEESEQKLPELLSQKEQAENGLNQINAAMDDLNMQRKMIQDSIHLIDISIEKAQNTPTTDESSEAIKNKVIENLNNGKVYLQGKIAEIDSTIAKKAELEAAIPQLQDAIDQIQAGVAKKAKLQSQLNQLLNAKNQLNSAYVNLINGESQYEDGVSKIQDAKNAINSNIEKLALSKAEFNVRKHDALKEINEAQEEIDKMRGKWIVLDRDSHYSYRDYGACADRMDGIAKVFPVFFFLVAALVCMTTMTRMVDEQRNEMGTLKALGYSKSHIALKYIIYAFSASVLGSILGCSLGMYLFPTVIFNAWNTLYNIEKIHFLFQPGLILLASGSVTGITLLATLYSIYSELFEMPSQLMRPKAAKAGKKIMLEKIPLIWKRLSFLQKVTARNIFRYKKRFFMTVIGIGGCMGLILVGFGLQDSITAIAKNQFVSLFTYQANAVLNSVVDESEKEALQTDLENYSGIDELLEMYCQNIELQTDKKTVDAVLEVPKELTNFNDFYAFRDRKSGEVYEFPTDGGAAISEKTATMLGVKAGDTVQLKKGDDIVDVKISIIVEHYVSHFLYLATDLYEELFGGAPDYNQLLMKYQDMSGNYETALGEKIMTYDGVAAISFTSDLIDQIDNMLRSLDIVIVVLIVSAGLLAFVVLYNLHNINITERQRELATLKVLGFFDGEVASYVYRENMVLTLFGVIAGMGIGTFLHHCVIQTVEVDMMMFGRNVFPRSYGWSALITLAFALFVNFMMFYRLRKIDMIESLKSVE